MLEIVIVVISLWMHSIGICTVSAVAMESELSLLSDVNEERVYVDDSTVMNSGICSLLRLEEVNINGTCTLEPVSVYVERRTDTEDHHWQIPEHSGSPGSPGSSSTAQMDSLKPDNAQARTIWKRMSKKQLRRYRRGNIEIVHTHVYYFSGNEN